MFKIKSNVIFYFLIVIIMLPPLLMADDSSKKPAWQMPLDEIRQITSSTGTGKNLKPNNWPNKSRAAVLFSLDVDNQSEVLSQGGRDRVLLSAREYGARRGIGRIVKVFDENNIPATFFMPAVSLQLAPEMMEIINESGHHEYAVHGWIHERAADLSPKEQREKLVNSVMQIEKLTGQRPVGFRAAGSSLTELTLPLLKELGFMYDSSLLADDFPYELNIDGKPSGLVELPPVYNLSDIALTITDRYAGGIYTPREVLQQAKDAFDVTYAEGGMMIFVMHPHISGRASRIVMLKELVKYMKARDDIWFATHKQAAEYIRQ